jgi:hypothetical protein
VIAPHVKKIVIANPKQVRIIAHAKIKTDTFDAKVLAIGLPACRRLRKVSTAAQTAGAAWLGDECGLDERSRKPSTPSTSNRSIHLPTVFDVVLNRRAAAAFNSPQSTTARTIISRPLGVKGAFLCVSIRFLANH